MKNPNEHATETAQAKDAAQAPDTPAPASAESGTGDSNRTDFRRLAILVVSLLVVGGLLIFAGQRYFSSLTVFEATVIDVGDKGGIATFTFDDPDKGGEVDADVATVPEGMKVEPGDTVRIRIDVDKGNFVEEVLE